jgi:hypothetical protein
MIVSIHQPHYLPWLGYYNKIFNSDCFVWLHNVQFRKNYFQNRTKIKSAASTEFWLTIPVHASTSTNIDAVVEVNNKWHDAHCQTIHQFYRKAPFYRELSPELFKVLMEPETRLDTINFNLLKFTLQLLEYKGTITRVDELLPLSSDPNLRLIEICKKLNATSYVAGRGGRNYLDLAMWEGNNLNVFWQEYAFDNLKYSQIGNGFISGLSILDPLFNVGVEETRKLILSGWSISK